jgi:uncharacterized protein YecE (DUF72 family)
MLDHGVSKVLADPERCPSETKNILKAAGVTYFRLHGSPIIYRSAYNKNYLAKLNNHMMLYPEAWCVFDNTSYGAATGNALDLLKINSP